MLGKKRTLPYMETGFCDIMFLNVIKYKIRSFYRWIMNRKAKQPKENRKA